MDNTIMRPQSIIFYFSGTGNSEFIAKVIAENLEFCEAQPIEKYTQESNVEVSILGFVFPVYWWGLPNIVRGFIERLKVKNADYVFAAVTMGVSSGNAIPYVKELLEVKGIELSAGFEYHMVDNYIIAHGSPEERKIQELVSSAYKKVLVDVKQIQAGKRTPIRKTRHLVRMINNHYVDTYKKIDKKFCVSENCIRCGLCEKECPAKNIAFIDGTLTWKHKCESCMRCIQICPKKAINYGNKTSERERYIMNYDKGIKIVEQQHRNTRKS